MKNILLAPAALVSLMPALPALAQTCTAVPDCAVMGYTKTESQCAGRSFTRCPFDDTKYNCNTPSAADCISWGYTDSKVYCSSGFVSCPGNTDYVRCVTSAAVGDLKYSWATKDHDGWLLCDGRTITKAVYPDLYAVVGSKLPKYSGYFLKGAASTSKTTFKTAEAAGLPNITGSMYLKGTEHASTADGAFSGEGSGNYGIGHTKSGASFSVTFDASRSSSIYGKSTTVTPQNYSANIFIYAGKSENDCVANGYWASKGSGMTCTTVTVGSTTCYKNCKPSNLQDLCRETYTSTAFAYGTDNKQYYPDITCYQYITTCRSGTAVTYQASEKSEACKDVYLVKSCTFSPSCMESTLGITPVDYPE